MKKICCGVIDYGMGNLHSVSKIFEVCGGDVIISNSKNMLSKADILVLPGVGEFGSAMKNLYKDKLTEFILNWIFNKKPFIGICLGYQILFKKSEESKNIKGLEVIDGEVVKFKKAKKIPHMGWNKIDVVSQFSSFVKKGNYFYFVHSFFPITKNKDIVFSTTEYGERFISAILHKNIFACQFHPEKSSLNGVKLIKNIMNYFASFTYA